MQTQPSDPVSNRHTPPLLRACTAVAAAKTADGSVVVDEHFGRCEGFLLFKSEDDAVGDWVPNTKNAAAHGAGTGASQLLVSHGVTVLIAPRLGPKARKALQAAGVACFEATSGASALVALAECRTGQLQPLSAAE